MKSYLPVLFSEPRPLSFTTAATFLSGPGQTYFISLFVGLIGASLGLSAGEMGSVYLASTFTAACVLPLLGHWIDRIDLRLFSALAFLGLAGACAVMTSVQGPVSLFLAFFLLRLTGQGMMTHIAMTSTARYFTATRGRALSITATGFPLGEAVMPLAAVTLIALVGWRGAYGVLAAVIVLVAMPFLLWLIWRKPAFTRPAPRKPGGQQPRLIDGLKILGRSRFFWLALPLLIYMPFTSTALIFHLQSIAAGKGWNSELVAAAYTGYAIAHAGGLFLAGGPIDRIGARRILPLMNMPFFLGIVVLALFDARLALIAFLCLMGVSAGLVQVTLGAVWAEIYGTRNLGSIRSLAVMLMVAGTASGPAIVGWLLDQEVAVASIGAGLIAAGLLASLLGWIAQRQAQPAEAESA